jgi:hypothetical protein
MLGTQSTPIEMEAASVGGLVISWRWCPFIATACRSGSLAAAVPANSAERMRR